MQASQLSPLSREYVIQKHLALALQVKLPFGDANMRKSMECLLQDLQQLAREFLCQGQWACHQ